MILTSPENSKVLVIAAHPDDEVLGCGGTMARLVSEGQEVAVAILGEGITSRYQDRADADRKLLTSLHSHSHAAMEALGVKKLEMFQLPDNRFDSVPLLDVIKIIEELIERHQPSIVFTHHPADLNVDHRVLHNAVLTATRPMEGHPVRELYCFEIASSTEWSFSHSEPQFRPNVFFDISGALAAKKRAMACYTSELREFPHPRSLDAMDAIARRWGSVVGCHAAEAFQLVRAIR